jgi:hypothetical protein
MGARRCGHRRRARLAGGICRRRRGGRARDPIIAANADLRVTFAICCPPAQIASPGLRAGWPSVGPAGGDAASGYQLDF